MTQNSRLLLKIVLGCFSTFVFSGFVAFLFLGTNPKNHPHLFPSVLLMSIVASILSMLFSVIQILEYLHEKEIARQQAKEKRAVSEFAQAFGVFPFPTTIDVSAKKWEGHVQDRVDAMLDKLGAAVKDASDELGRLQCNPEFIRHMADAHGLWHDTAEKELKDKKECVASALKSFWPKHGIARQFGFEAFGSVGEHAERYRKKGNC